MPISKSKYVKEWKAHVKELDSVSIDAFDLHDSELWNTIKGCQITLNECIEKVADRLVNDGHLTQD